MRLSRTSTTVDSVGFRGLLGAGLGDGSLDRIELVLFWVGGYEGFDRVAAYGGGEFGPDDVVESRLGSHLVVDGFEEAVRVFDFPADEDVEVDVLLFGGQGTRRDVDRRFGVGGRCE